MKVVFFSITYISLFVLFFYRCTKCENEDDLRTYIKSNLGMFKDTFGVVLYLYSIVLTKVCYIIRVEKKIMCDRVTQ